MTTRPITLRPWQVRAALDGRLRRIVEPLKVQPRARGAVWHQNFEGGAFLSLHCPTLEVPHLHYATGDLLWGREVWTLDGCADGCAYRADGEPPAHLAHVRWRSPVTMPKWASRWTLTVGEVRVCRVQDVTSDEAAGYGFDLPPVAALHALQGRWLADHGPGSWAANPWCVSAAVEVRKGNVDE